MARFTDRVHQIQQEIAQRDRQPEESQQEIVAVLTFILAQERYALPLSTVREVSRPRPISVLPGLPSAVLGAMGLRGKVLAVLDLGQIIELGEGTIDSTSRIIVVQHEEVVAAFLVDQIQDIATIPHAALRPPPAKDMGGTAQFLQGIAGDGAETIRLLDLSRLLEAVYHGE